MAELLCAGVKDTFQSSGQLHTSAHVLTRAVWLLHLTHHRRFIIHVEKVLFFFFFNKLTPNVQKSQLEQSCVSIITLMLQVSFGNTLY